MKQREITQSWSITLAMNIKDRITLDGSFNVSERQAWIIAMRFRAHIVRTLGVHPIAMIIKTNQSAEQED